MDNDLHRLGIKLKFVYSLVGLLLGLACILTGLVLGLNGVAGHTGWTASVLGLSTTLNDAAPGVVVFIVGVLMVFLTRFKVVHERSGEGGQRAEQIHSGDDTNATATSGVEGQGSNRSSPIRRPDFLLPNFRERISYFQRPR